MSDVDDDIQEEVHGDDPEFVDNDDDPEFVDNDDGGDYHLWVKYYDGFAKKNSMVKECNSKNRGGPYYEYQQNDISMLEPPEDLDFEFRNLVWTTSKHDVYHMSNNAVFYYSAVTGKKSEVLDFSGTVTPVEKHPGNWLQGLTDTLVTTLAIKDKLLVAGGFDGELICKYLDRPGVSFCSRVKPDGNAMMNCIEIYNSPSGAVHFTASSRDGEFRDGEVRDFDVETFQLSKQIDFPWQVHHTSLSPDGKLLVVVGESNDGLLVNLESGKTIRTLQGYKDSSVASAWHPDGKTFVIGKRSNSCHVWDARFPLKMVTILKNYDGAASINFTSDGKFMAVAEPRDYVHIYNVMNEYNVMRREDIRFFGEITGISFSPDTESLFIGNFHNIHSSLLQFRRCRKQYIDFDYF